ncbi:MAG TPA: chromosomal replication initiator protein DnaA [Acidimicrobiales bacterium]|nr:chromosomal replication initiator protein DnaA [Acidimicrobiales bacterium]
MEDDVRDSEEIWSEVRESLRGNASESVWSAGLNTLRLVDFHDDQLVIGAPNAIQLQRVQQRYLPFITEQARQVLGDNVRVSLTLSDTEVTGAPALDDASAEALAPPPSFAAVDRPARLDPRMTFDSFVPGSSNRLAFAAAQSVAETPGRAYNPLMIYGNSGLGKTHLLHAIGNYVQENYPGRKVLYVSTETFLNDFIRAIQTRTQLALHERYRENDVLLIDDIQFMETRGETFHEEIFHTYNALHGEGKQIVLTSDRSPRDLAGLQERFRSRLLQGLVTEIDQPDLETRIAILRSKSEREGIELPNDVAEWIAHRVRDNIRELEGSVTMLRAFANLRQEPISLELAKAHLTNLGHEQVVLKPETILSVVAEFYGLTVEDVRGAKRLRPLVRARHIAMYLIRDLLDNYSYPMIARIFDGRNHTTVISGVEKIKEQMAANGELLAQVNQLKRQCLGEGHE